MQGPGRRKRGVHETEAQARLAELEGRLADCRRENEVLSLALAEVRDARRREAFLDAVIDNIPAIVIVKNAVDGRAVLVNRTTERLFNISAQDYLGKTNQEMYEPEVAARFDAFDRHALANSRQTEIEADIFSVPQYGGRYLKSVKTVVTGENGEPDLIITLATDVTAQKRAEDEAVRLAHYDPLTGLANRTLFSRELERALVSVGRGTRRIALLCLDLDGFKSVNDSFGHGAGDQLLIAVSSRLAACVRGSDLVARLGGDEFVVVQDITAPRDAERLARRIVMALTKPFEVGGNTIVIGTSIGIEIGSRGCRDAQALMHRADLALYEVKSQGKNGFLFYSSQMGEVANRRMTIERDLREALRKKQFALHFQPIFDLVGGAVVGHEALLRWHHPERGLVAPSEFIGIAEENGLIAEIGEWVLRRACRTASGWPEAQSVAVNVSPVQFGRQDLAGIVKKALAEAGLAPSRLELEITEDVLFRDEAHNRRILDDLRRQGVRIVMDDFGTGYSSLSYLRTFHFDKIKIDQCFTRDLPGDLAAMSIIRAVVDMARALDVTITIEGVETDAQLAAVRDLGCHQAQGFLIGRPALQIQ